jgi:hypothetical protein
VAEAVAPSTPISESSQSGPEIDPYVDRLEREIGVALGGVHKAAVTAASGYFRLMGAEFHCD